MCAEYWKGTVLVGGVVIIDVKVEGRRENEEGRPPYLK